MTSPVVARDTCRLCGSADLKLSVPLASVPIVSPNVGTERDAEGKALTTIVAPLDNYLCGDCGLIQLIHVVDPTLIYGNYLYRTAVSLGLRQHFGGLAEAVMGRLDMKPGQRVVEFGSNDGTLLRFFLEAGMAVEGVEPASAIAAEATASGIPTRACFFGVDTATSLVTDRGPARAILANNVMANIDTLPDIFGGVKTLLAPNGAFVFETQYALDVFEKTLLDVIYHEHISCFSVRPLVRALGRFGLEVFDAERIATKGGSIRFWVQHAGGPQPIAPRVAELLALEDKFGLYDMARHKAFSDNVAAIKAELIALVDAAKATGRPVAAYGTSVGCAALIHQFDLADRLDFLLDDTPFKDHLEGPGYRLPIYTGDAVLARNPALIVALAWRYIEPIAKKHRTYLENGGRFVVPLPGVTVIDKPVG